MEISSEQRIRHILSFSPAIIYTCNVDGDYGLTFVSENVLQQFGYTPAECLGKQNFWREVIHPDDYAYVFDGSDGFLSTGREIREYRLRKKDGNYIWVHDELRLIRDDQGTPVEIIGSWLNITDRKNAEDALRNSENLFREFFLTNPVATIITSPEGLVHMVNPAFIDASGYSIQEVVGRTSLELGFWQNPEDRQRMVSAIRQHGFMDRLEADFYCKGNRRMTCLVSSRAIKHEGELRILSIVIDLSEQRAAEEAMRKLEKAKSDFISTVAHELRTPLIAIVGYCELLENAEVMGFTDEQRRHYLSISSVTLSCRSGNNFNRSFFTEG